MVDPSRSAPLRTRFVEDPDALNLDFGRPPFKLNTLHGSLSISTDTEPIGHGCLGTVYKGVSSDGTPMAVKVIPIMNKLVREKTNAEIEKLKSLRHANIVGLHGHIVVTDYAYLVMELLEGSLASHLDALGPMGEGAWNCLRQVLLGLQFVHENGIIHRDIKPENVMVSGNGIFKLVDFGISIKYESGWSDHACTPQYMAPEFALRLPITFAYDIWSFGIMALRLYTKKFPKFYDGCRSVTDFVVQIPKASFGKIIEGMQLDVVFTDFLEKCLKAKPNERQDCTDLLKHTFVRLGAHDVAASSSHGNGLPVPWIEPSDGIYELVSVRLTVPSVQRMRLLYSINGENPDLPYSEAVILNVPGRYCFQAVAVDSNETQSATVARVFVIVGPVRSPQIFPEGGRFDTVEVRLYSEDRWPIHHLVKPSDEEVHPFDPGAVYQAPFTLSKRGCWTVYAFCVVNGKLLSKTKQARFEILGDSPIINPGVKRSPIFCVTIHHPSKPDVIIRYTKTGHTPTRQSDRYQRPLIIASPGVVPIKAFAEIDALRDSGLSEREYTVTGTIRRPEADPDPGWYPPGISITLRSPQGYPIQYSLVEGVDVENGLEYKFPIVLDMPGTYTIRAMAFVPDEQMRRGILRGYTKLADGELEIPVLTSEIVEWVYSIDDGPLIKRKRFLGDTRVDSNGRDLNSPDLFSTTSTAGMALAPSVSSQSGGQGMPPASTSTFGNMEAVFASSRFMEQLTFVDLFHRDSPNQVADVAHFREVFPRINICQDQKATGITLLTRKGAVGFNPPTIEHGGCGDWPLCVNLPPGDYSQQYACSVKAIALSGRTRDLLFELGLLSRLKHPNIIPIAAVTITPDMAYFLRQTYFPSLREMLNQRTVRCELVAYYSRQILLGLCYLHSIGITHGCLTPETVFVVGEGRIRISIVHLAGRPCEISCYSAPEIINPDYFLRSRCDSWSFGVMVLEMVLGRLPPLFEDWALLSEDQRLLKVEMASYETVTEGVRADLSPDLADLVSRCLLPDHRRAESSELLQLRFVSRRFLKTPKEILDLLPSLETTPSVLANYTEERYRQVDDHFVCEPILRQRSSWTVEPSAAPLPKTCAEHVLKLANIYESVIPDQIWR